MYLFQQRGALGAEHMGPFGTQSEIGQSQDKRGLYFASVSREAYAAFIIRRARSDEISPI